jgi:molybdenum cofactor cytidylyltransferase
VPDRFSRAGLIVFVSGIVLAAGDSTRFRASLADHESALGEAKQLLPYRGRSLLDAALDTARVCAFDQRIVALGGSAEAVRERVDLRGFTTVDVPQAGTGCGASVSTAVAAVDPRADGLVLLLGDQPQVRETAVASLVAAAGDSSVGLCRYEDGVGHPFWFRREVFGALRELRGDKAVWKVVHSGRFAVTEVAVAGAVPLDVDTWADYERLLAGGRAGDHLVG